ncbi:hypothetical protein DKX38_003228 [Salix brachista]|uniref:glutathione transferase n=1 Tax=Salix brachista TaxID=2182728 RepID=A0A5N5NPB5_9ROSI|nr:hypothetical protein DKX38_003228 [Salix brachista]
MACLDCEGNKWSRDLRGVLVHKFHSSARKKFIVTNPTRTKFSPSLSLSALLTEEVMAPFKLHGSVLSTNTQRVLATLYEKDVEFELVNVNLGAGEQKQEPHISLNPFGLVPAAVIGDLKLFESRAISQYVAHQYSSQGTHLGAAGNGYAIILVWQEVESHQFDPSASKLVWEQVFKPVFGLQTDAALVAETEVTLGKVLDVYEARLSHSKYLAGDSFTLADLHHLPNIQALQGTPSKKLFDSRPRVCAWVARITGRPAWGKVLSLCPK